MKLISEGARRVTFNPAVFQSFKPYQSSVLSSNPRGHTNTSFLTLTQVSLFPGQRLGASVAHSVHSGDDQRRSFCDHCE